MHRRVSVYGAPASLQQQWAGLQCLLWVERWGTREGKPFHAQVGYISALELSANDFLRHMQQHWSLENRLHWIRDVTLQEDHARPGGSAPVMWAVLNCFLISIVRHLGFRTLPQGVRALTNQVERIDQILTQGFSSA